MYNIALRFLAQSPLSDELQALLAYDKKYAVALAGNRHLCDDVWFFLYSKKPLVKSEMASSLLCRDLSDSQVSHVLSFEKRVTLLSSLFANNTVSVEDQKKIVASKSMTSSLAQKVLSNGWFDHQFDSSLTKKAGGQVLLEYMAYKAVEEEAEILFSDYASWASKRHSSDRTEALHVLFFRFEKILVEACRSVVPHVRTAAAGFYGLTDDSHIRLLANVEGSKDWDVAHGYLLLSLVNNPGVSLDVVKDVSSAAHDVSSSLVSSRRSMKKEDLPEGVTLSEYHQSTYQLMSVMEKVGMSADSRLAKKREAVLDYASLSDENVLQWLSYRAAPTHGDFGFSPGKLPELLALCDNSSLSENQVSLVLKGLQSYAPSYKQFSFFVEACTLFLETYELKNDFLEELEEPGRSKSFSARNYSDPAKVVFDENKPLVRVYGTSVNSDFQYLDSFFSTEEWQVAFSLMDECPDVTLVDFVSLVKSL